MSATFTHEGTFRADLDAGDLKAGTVGTARLGSGSATSGTFLRGDQTWASPTATVTGYKQTFGNGATTVFDFTHNLGTLDVVVQYHTVGAAQRRIEPPTFCQTDVIDADTVRSTFAQAPASNEFRIIIIPT